ncbi:MAG: RHS repeat-associated core domain-containing protein, partial [Acidobacteriaceae bacterium]
GTKRMQTTASGNSQETCTSNPFGDGLNCAGGADATEDHFTGKDHDTESGLDYFYARYYSETLGRFMTPDWAAAPAAVPYAAYGDPQTLNLYDYVQNNPLTGIDATGHYSSSDPMADAEEGEQDNAAGQSNQQSQASSAGSSGNGNSTGTPGTNKTPGTNPPPKAPGDGKSPSGSTTAVGNTVDNETSGLRPESKSGQSSSQSLHTSKVAIADVVHNRDKAGIKGGVASSKTTASESRTPQYKDAQSAASQAAHSPDITHGSVNFYLNYGQRPPGWARGKSTTSYGPFENASGHGDVPKGAQVYVVIVH